MHITNDSELALLAAALDLSAGDLSNLLCGIAHQVIMRNAAGGPLSEAPSLTQYKASLIKTANNYQIVLDSPSSSASATWSEFPADWLVRKDRPMTAQALNPANLIKS